MSSRPRSASVSPTRTSSTSSSGSPTSSGTSRWSRSPTASWTTSSRAAPPSTARRSPATPRSRSRTSWRCPTWATFKVLPWSQNHERTAFVFCDILDRDYQPYEGDPRWVLRRQLKRAADMGLEFYVGPELEYFYFQGGDGPELTDEGGYFDVLPADLGNDLRKQTMRTLDRLDIPMEASHHEVAPSQHEIDPHYDEALRDGRPRHDLAPHRQGGRGAQRRVRDLHAQAAARRQRQRDARPPVDVPRRRERLLQRRRPGPPLGPRQGVHRRPAASTCARSARSSTSG